MNKYKVYVNIGIILLVVFVISQSYYFHRYDKQLQEANSWVEHTNIIINMLFDLRGQSRQIEHLYLKHILDKDDLTNYQENMDKLKVSVFNSVDTIYKITRDQQQKKRIKYIEWLFQNGFDLVQKNNIRDRKSVLNAYDMLSIKVYPAINEMIAQERKFLEQRNNSDALASKKIKQFIVMSSLITYAVLFIMVFFLVRTFELVKIKENRLSRAVKGTSDGLWDWNINTNKVYYSERFKEILGYTNEYMKNDLKSFTSLIHPDDYKKNFSIVEQHLKSGKPCNLEFRVRAKNGKYLWINLRGDSVFNKKGKPTNMSGFITDISQRRDIEEMKDAFISTVSHELRTPLTAIRASLGLVLAEAEGPLTEGIRKFLEISFKNTERLIVLINDILDIEKLTSKGFQLNLAIASINDLIEQSIKLNQSYADKYKIEFILHKAPENVQVNVDKSRILQVLTNLISNASKFSSPNSKVNIFADIVNDVVRISVVDRGKGMPIEFQKNVFKRFSQASNITENEGTGLGLSICKEIIEKHQGKIGFTSEENKGTTFYFELPILQKMSFQNHMKTKKQSKLKFLICEGDFQTAKILKNIIENQGFAVDIAYNAEEARKLLKKEEYIAITMETLLPDQDGMALVQEIRNNEKTQHLPIIVISIETKEELNKIKMQGHAINVIDWIIKPVDHEKLLRSIKLIKKKSVMPIILYVEDNRDLINILTHRLKDTAEMVPATTLGEAKNLLASQYFDLVLLDIALPDGSGLELLDGFINYSTSVIILSATEVSNEIKNKVNSALVKSQISEEEIIKVIQSVLINVPDYQYERNK